MDSIKIGIISDLHRVSVDRNTTPPELTQLGDDDGHIRRVTVAAGAYKMGQAITDFNAANVDCTVFLGDNLGVDEAAGAGATVKSCADLLASECAGFDNPVHQIIGHHDTPSANYDDPVTNAAYYETGSAMGSLFATSGEHKPQNVWWYQAVAADTPMTYSISLNGFKLIFLTSFYATVGFATLGNMTGVTGITMGDWLEDRLNEAEADDEQPIVFYHMRLRGSEVPPGAGLDPEIGREILERNWKRQPIVVNGHLHSDQSVRYFSGTPYIQIHGALHSVTLSDEGGAHAILTVHKDIVEVDGNVTDDANWSLTGYGFHTTETSFDKMLVNQWLLNEPAGTSGADTIIDSIGGYNGTPLKAKVNSTALDGVTPSMVFDADNQDVQGLSLEGVGGISSFPSAMSIWFKMSGTDRKDMFCTGHSSESSYFRTYYTGGQVYYNVFGKIAVTTTGFNDDEWHFLTGVSETDSIHKIYIDGVLEDTDTTLVPVPPSIDQFSIGRREPSVGGIGDSNRFDGELHDARIFLGLITQDDVTSMYQAGFEPLPGTDTKVSDEIVLQTPTFLIDGNYYNPDTGNVEEYLNETLQNNVTKSGNTFDAPDKYTFVGPVTISFASKYPLKTYPNITRAKNQFIGEHAFGYQSDKAEIRYNFSGGNVHSKSTLYKGPITLNHNTAGSDNIVFNYKIFYKGKTSHAGSIHLSIDKTDNSFYSFNENG